MGNLQWVDLKRSLEVGVAESYGEMVGVWS